MKKNFIKVLGLVLVLLVNGCSLKTGYELEKNESIYIGESK